MYRKMTFKEFRAHEARLRSTIDPDERKELEYRIKNLVVPETVPVDSYKIGFFFTV